MLGRILYVDDDADMRMMAQLALETVGGFSLQMCESGEQVLVCQQDSDKFVLPDLLLLDVVMPGLSGPETLKTLRQASAWQAIPVVMLSAQRDYEGGALQDLPGVIGVIAKPFQPLNLAQQLKALWEKSNRD